MQESGVFELPGLSDGAVAALLQGAEALLFPSFAEGFGLPPVEAMALGTPVICSKLTVLQDILGDYPVYLDPHASYSWMETINHAVIREQTTEGDQTRQRVGRKVPRWTDHFDAVLSLV